MNGSIAWRGALKKHTMLLYMLNESITKPEDVVFDVNASTGRIVHVFVLKYKTILNFAIWIPTNYNICLSLFGASIRACRGHGQHVIIMKAN